MIKKFGSFKNDKIINVNAKISKNQILIEEVSKLDLNNIKDTDIIDIVCNYGLCVEDRGAYGEWNKYMVYNRNEESMFQTPKQIADTILELLKHDINTYCEVGIFKGGSHLLITSMLKLKNPNLQSVGIDIQDRHLTENIKKYINLHIGTSEDFKKQKFDLVFIDGDHSYEGVSTDYNNLGQYANIVMFHDINDTTCPGVVQFWNEVKVGKKYKEFTYQTNNEGIQGIGLLFNEYNKYPEVRHLSTYESAIFILENNSLMSRNELRNNNFDIDSIKGTNSKDKWWEERKELENERFGTENLIYCTPDWYGDYGYETGHGSVMIYFKPSIFEDFKVTLTLLDSLNENETKIYNHKEIQKIYLNIINNNKSNTETKKILENLNHKNKGSLFNTSRGRIFIEGDRFYNKYSEIQIHANEIPIEYIKEIRLTNNYLDVKNTDDINREKLISICKSKNIKIS